MQWKTVFGSLSGISSPISASTWSIRPTLNVCVWPSVIIPWTESPKFDAISSSWSLATYCALSSIYSSYCCCRLSK